MKKCCRTKNGKRSKENEILKAGQVYIKAEPEIWNLQLATVIDKAGAGKKKGSIPCLSAFSSSEVLCTKYSLLAEKVLWHVGNIEIDITERNENYKNQ